jgi:hypothetical protein
MSHHELILYWLTLGFEFVLCILVYVRNLQGRLPFFSVYAAVLLTFTLSAGLVYGHFGYRSPISYYAAWITITVDMLARSTAIAELCRYSLQAYRGIWALVWRSLTFLAVFFLAHAAVDAWGQLNRLAIYELTVERDIEISSIVILLAMFLIRRYYGLTLEPLHARIAGGILIFCLIEFVNNTILRDIFAGPLSSWFHTAFKSSWSAMSPQVDRVNELWNTVQAFAAIVSISIWCYALRKPLPAPAQEPDLLPAEVYGKLSPAVNLRLRAFNDRLQEMLKP